jgi:hypothetical protein
MIATMSHSDSDNRTQFELKGAWSLLELQESSRIGVMSSFFIIYNLFGNRLEL